MPSIEVLPDPQRMIEGLRDTGYEFTTAVADLIDNSIAANATAIVVDIRMDYGGNITLSVTDNGIGMDEAELTTAMRYGSPPRADRHSLGKFGLGMKTASTAFCRKLSIITRKSGTMEPIKATWDLDHVARVNRWELLLSTPSRLERGFLDTVSPNKSGTVVIWENVDRLLKEYSDPGGNHARRALDRKISELQDHVGMVYQRFLDPLDTREDNKVTILVNSLEIKSWDPFCKQESKLVLTQTMPVAREGSNEILGEFTVNAFILPRSEEFSTPEAAKAAKISNENQGIYIYRENRLIHEADWLGMYTKEPHLSLLRVEFSFNADLDEAFNIDIKKSRILLNSSLYRWLQEEYLPAPRRAAEQQSRIGQRRISRDAARGAHDRSNRAIQQKVGEIDQAHVRIVDQGRGEVEVQNPTGTTRLVLVLVNANKPGEIYVQPVEEIRDGLLYQPALISGNQGVQINTSHDFYRKVYLPNIFSTTTSISTIQGFDSLLWALSVAELRATNQATKDHFSEMRFEISRILRKLVEHLPEPDTYEERVG